MRMAYVWRGVLVATAVGLLVSTPTLADGADEPATAPVGTAPPAATSDTSPPPATESQVAPADDPATTAPATSDPDSSSGDSGGSNATDTSAPPTTEPTDTTGTSAPPTTEPTDTTGTSAPPTDQAPGTSAGGAGNPHDGDSGGDAPMPGNTSSQSVQVTSIQVAVANTGGNTSTTDVSNGGASTSSATATAQVLSGSASAVGSSDSTTLVQQAATQVSGNASAQVIQISIVFNIGAAAAKTGDNTLSAGSGSTGSGSITTGSAVAIGNDSAVYATQGASASATTGTSDSAQQDHLVLNIGVALSNTGDNTIVATLSGSGSASATTGSASAIGNQSTTSVTQLATGIVGDGGNLTIEQRAAIVNLGLALADSGSNTIGAAVTTALQSGDSADFQRLLEAIVPELLKTANPAPAAESDTARSGSVATGDATAIGNRSSTVVQQVAVGAANGGSVFVGQNMVIVNAGVASASTGDNAIGAPSATALDPDAQAIVAQLAAFLSGLLGQIDAWSNGDTAALEGGSLSTTFGGLDIDLDSSLTANETPSTAGSSVTIRQLSAVINLAFALASSGGNATDTVIAAIPTPALAAESRSSLGAVSSGVSSGTTVVIVTGNASATNSNLVVVCELRNTADVKCLGPDAPEEQEPPTTLPGQVEPQAGSTELPSQPVDVVMDTPSTAPADPPADAPAAAPAALRLAQTGGSPFPTLAVACAAVLLGSLLLLAHRRRREFDQPDQPSVEGR